MPQQDVTPAVRFAAEVTRYRGALSVRSEGRLVTGFMNDLRDEGQRTTTRLTRLLVEARQWAELLPEVDRLRLELALSDELEPLLTAYVMIIAGRTIATVPEAD